MEKMAALVTLLVEVQAAVVAVLHPLEAMAVEV
jgi:hypothetical protein